MKSEKSTEKGQAMVLLALAVIVLLGFTALAIDGGMAYSDRRDAQKGSDAASLAGAGYIGSYFDTNAISSGQWDCSALGNVQMQARVVASDQAEKNGHFIDDNSSNNAIVDNNGVRTVCSSDNQGGYIDVITNISSVTETGFAHLVYDGQVRNSVETITRVRPRTAIGFGNAIVALREDCDGGLGGVTVGGGGNEGEVIVHDGGIFSNACIVGNGGITVTVTLEDDDVGEWPIACIGDECFTDGGIWDPEPVEIPEADRDEYRLDRDEFSIPTPNCADEEDDPYDKYDGSGTISPGNYSTIKFTDSKESLYMEPGLYCVSTEFSALGAAVIGHGVTIYLSTQTASFTTASTTVVKLSAPPQADAEAPYLFDAYDSDLDPEEWEWESTVFKHWYNKFIGEVHLSTSDPQILYDEGCVSDSDSDSVRCATRGMLIYAKEGNDSTIKMTGSATSFYLGTVITLDGEIKFSGTGDNFAMYSGQFIADTVTIDGGTKINITYNDDFVYEDPAELDLHQ